MGALEEIAAAAGKKDLGFILLKGAAMLAQGISAPETREMTDLDILIKPADEKAFDTLFAELDFKPMENSSQAYYRVAALSAPPVIADLHTGLWQEKAARALWHRSRPLSSGLVVLGFEDQLLHLASHGLLYHGRLPARTFEDIAGLLELVYGKTDRADFWLKTARIAAENGLNPVIYPALRRFLAARPGLISESELFAFKPRGYDKLKGGFFEKAALGHSRMLEYFLPGLYRPALFFKYLFPGATFLERRYGKVSRLNRFMRPFQLLVSVLGSKHRGE